MPMTMAKRTFALLPVFVFLLLAALSVQVKSPGWIFACEAAGTHQTATEELRAYLQDREAGRPNLRVVPRIVLATLEQGAMGVLSLGFLDPTASALYQGSPRNSPFRIDKVEIHCAVRIASWLTFVFLALSPILLLSFRWLRRTLTRVAFVGAAMSVILGWHPNVVSLVIMGGEKIVDWPHSYYLFDQYVNAENFWALGLVSILYLALADALRLRPVHYFLLAIVGQLSIEYFGPLLVGAAVLCLVVFPADRDGPSPRRHGGRLTLAALVGMVLAAGLAAGAFYLGGGSVEPVVATQENPHQHIDNNIAWLNVIIANLVMMTLLPFVAGGLVGFVDSLLPGPAISKEHVRRDVIISAALFLGFVGVFVIGLFTAAYPSEMGRQFLPMALVAVFLGARSGTWVVTATTSRGNA